MASILKVDTIQDQSGNNIINENADTITIGASGDVIAVPAGSASAPVITTTGDTNTGMFFPAADTIAFTEGGTEAMRMDSSGNLLIGTTSALGSNSSLTISTTRNSGLAATIGLMRMGSQNGGGEYPFIGYNLIPTATATVNYGGSDFASYIRFAAGKVETFTAAAGTGGNAISPTTGPYVAQGGTSWTSPSDERLKNITEEISNALDKIKKISAVKYTWKNDLSAKPQVGLIAQEFLNILPEVVVVPESETDKYGNQQYMGVNYDKVVPLLVAGIKEQQAIIEQLEARITTLENK